MLLNRLQTTIIKSRCFGLGKFLSTSAVILILALGLAALSRGQDKPSAEQLFPIVQDNRYGFIDASGSVVITPQFAAVRDFSEGLAAVQAFIGTEPEWGFIDKTGRMVIPPTLDIKNPRKFSEGLASVVTREGRCGYIDRGGRVVLKARFRQAFDFLEGLARVEDDGKYGFIDKTGTVVVDLIFDDATDFKHGLALVTLGTKRGYIDKTGKYIWKPSK